MEDIMPPNDSAPPSDSLDAVVPKVRELRDRFTAITEPHRPPLWRFCLRLTGSPWDAEDLVQEVLMRAFARLGGLWQPLEDPRAYLFRTASNAWLDGLRRARLPLGGLEEAEDVPVAPAVVQRLDVTDALERLATALLPRQRVVFLLTQAFDFTAGEVAAMLGTTEGAVKALLHRARQALGERSGAAASGPAPAEGEPVLARFVEAFNAHDTAALLALLEPHASVDIVGVAEEWGREAIAKNSLADTFADPVPQRAAPGLLAGERVVLVFSPGEDGRVALSWLIRLGVEGGRVTSWRSYYFTPELIAHAAAELGVPARPAAYRFVAAGEGHAASA
jgi:RNA polymerase sigma factor (sigma-70 family)